ncbi:MAG: endoribonuclease ysh1, partial [Claussenomyces sp. TS43310]
MGPKRKAAVVAAIAEEPAHPNDELMFLCLGGGNEVGRSCHILQYKGKTVMLDAGMHPAYDGLAGLPFYDDFDLSTVDVLLISHFHIDHAASLPYVLSKTNFKGRVFMTHPTKAIYKWLIQDSVRVSGSSTTSMGQNSTPYTEADHLSTFPMIEAIDYHTTHTISSIRITPLPAGHVLGAAMFLISISGLNILFTGDYSIEADRHLISASVPSNIRVDVLITESTYGVASHIPRLEREQALMKSITSILNRGGRVLMPVFALGRAQELLLILDEYWSKHKEFQDIPIYYASNLARKCMLVYQTYVGAMNDNVKRLFRERMAESEADSGQSSGGPWDFRHIRSLKSLDRFDDVGSCVMLASPGMMQNGVSRELLERWAPNDKNGVIITGYSVEGTMAKSIMQEPDQIQAIMSRNTGGARRSMKGDEGEKVMVPRRCSVQEFSFAAHVDGVENREFIEKVAAPVVILVHGEHHNMMRLKSKLLSLNASLPTSSRVKVFSPRNCEELRIPFKADKMAKVVGRLANMPPPSLGLSSINKQTENGDGGKIVTGVLVENDFKLSLMAAEDLREYAGLTTTVVICKQRMRLSAAGIDLIRWALEGTFGSIEEMISSGADSDVIDGDEDVHMNGRGLSNEADKDEKHKKTYVIMGCVIMHWCSSGEMDLEWEGNMLNDGIADAVMAVLLSVESSPAAVKRSSCKHLHSHGYEQTLDLPSRNPLADISSPERLDRLFMFLEAQFGSEALTPIKEPKVGSLASSTAAPKTSNSDMGHDIFADTEEDTSKHLNTELERLHKVGIPVPGIEIRVDKMIAKVWLEDLEVECVNKTFGDRVRVVVERAVE